MFLIHSMESSLSKVCVWVIIKQSRAKKRKKWFKVIIQHLILLNALPLTLMNYDLILGLL